MPGNGIEPRYLAGRDEYVELFTRSLKSFEDGLPRNTVVSGLRGTGKTVLLRRFKIIAESRGWLTVEREFNEIDTSVWFENHNTSSNSGWYGQFTGSPSATSYYLNTLGSWVNWNSSDSTKIIQDCSGINHSDTHGVMSGNLASGGTATWSLSTMSQYYNC